MGTTTAMVVQMLLPLFGAIIGGVLFYWPVVLNVPKIGEATRKPVFAENTGFALIS